MSQFSDILEQLDELECARGEDEFRRRIRARLLNLALFFRGCYDCREEVLGDDVKRVPKLSDYAEAEYELRVLAAQVEKVSSVFCVYCPRAPYFPPPRCWAHVVRGVGDVDD